MKNITRLNVLIFAMMLQVVLSFKSPEALVGENGNKLSNDIIDTTIIPVDSFFLKMMSTELIDFIHQSDSIILLSLSTENDSISDVLDTFHTYRVLGQRVVIENEVDTLKSILLNPDNYWITHIQKRCDFFPDIGIILKKGTEQRDMILSFHCDVLKVFNSDKTINKVLNIDQGHNQFVEIGNQYFDNIFSQYVTSNSNKGIDE